MEPLLLEVARVRREEAERRAQHRRLVPLLPDGTPRRTTWLRRGRGRRPD